MELGHPDFVVAGVQKCGTTSLFEHLAAHPEVGVSSVKEAHFFNKEPWPPALPAIQDYESLFPTVPATATGEASTGYFTNPDVPRRILRCRSEAKVVVMLRDPVVRMQSAHRMMVRNGYDIPSLEDVAADAAAGRPVPHAMLDNCLYGTHLSRWAEHFGLDRIFVATVEQMKEDGRGLLEGLFRFLGVDPAAAATIDHRRVHHPTRTPRNRVGRWIIRQEGLARFGKRIVPERVIESVGARLFWSDRRSGLPGGVARTLEPLLRPEMEQVERLLGRRMPELFASWD